MAGRASLSCHLKVEIRMTLQRSQAELSRSQLRQRPLTQRLALSDFLSIGPLLCSLIPMLQGELSLISFLSQNPPAEIFPEVFISVLVQVRINFPLTSPRSVSIRLAAQPRMESSKPPVPCTQEVRATPTELITSSLEPCSRTEKKNTEMGRSSEDPPVHQHLCSSDVLGRQTLWDSWGSCILTGCAQGDGGGGLKVINCSRQ